MGIIKSVGECVADLGLDVAKKYICEKIDDQKLKLELVKYIESQKDYFEISTLAEEFDFQGLIEYIKSESLTDIENRIFSVNKNERKQARESIINKAISYSHAEHKEAKQTVAKIVAICLDILRNFYRKKFSKKDYIIAADIVDAVSDEVERIVETKSNKIREEVLALRQELCAETSLSIQNAIKLAAAGDLGTIEDELKNFMKHLSAEHPLHPHYGYIFQNGDLRSAPKTDEGKIKYPPKYVFKGTVRAKDKIFTDFSENPLEYAYRHQLSLSMEVSEAKKLLGNEMDPIQREVEGYVGEEIKIVPPPFPSAFPCSIKVDDVVYFPYILLRTQEILDDGTLIIGNIEQDNCHYYFEIRLKLEKDGRCDFLIKLNEATSAELLNTARFMKDVGDEKLLQIHVLSQGIDLVTGRITEVNYRTGFDSIEQEIDFYERLCTIENRFNVQIKVQGNLYEDDYSLIKDISDLAMGKEVVSQWERETFTCVLDARLREALMNSSDTPCFLSLIGSGTTTIFGTQIDLLFKRIYRCAVMLNVEKTRQLAQLLDEGDTIRITFIAGEDSSYVDMLDISEEETKIFHVKTTPCE